MKFVSPWIHTTEKCNLRCHYCYVRGKAVMQPIVYHNLGEFLLKMPTDNITSEWIDEIQAWWADVFCMGIKKISSTVIRVGNFHVWTGEVGSDETDSDWYTNCKLIEVGT